ncbi:hypothetical protein [Halegenticoccus soli]|uniref:hypothetical protein n=1 Tax=Halegenticoccus soli TaxID=1985678 RepID=UPI00117A5F9F|nr:hypothetical protein [Halegenticoccus soli]
MLWNKDSQSPQSTRDESNDLVEELDESPPSEQFLAEAYDAIGKVFEESVNRVSEIEDRIQEKREEVERHKQEIEQLNREIEKLQEEHNQLHDAQDKLEDAQLTIKDGTENRQVETETEIEENS